LFVLAEIIRQLKKQSQAGGVDLANYGFGGNEDTEYMFDVMKKMWANNGNKVSH
jgi:hypothetical protein